MENTWRGAFQQEALRTDGYARTFSVRAYPPMGYGLYDMIGNVWEGSAGWYTARHGGEAHKACCGPPQPISDPKISRNSLQEPWL